MWRPNSLVVSGFLVEGRGHVDALGDAGGVVVDGALPVEVRELPADLPGLDRVLADARSLALRPR